MRNEIVKLAAVLFIICGIASGALAYTNELTYPTILEQRAQSETNARIKVMSAADNITEKISDEQLKAIADKLGISTDILNEIYIAKKGNDIVGYTVKCTVNGFGGGVGVLTGININDTISGVAVLSHNETPGLGAKAQDAVWISQFQDKKISSELNVIKIGTPKDNEVVAISGATITSRAVTSAVNYARLAFLELQGGK